MSPYLGPEPGSFAPVWRVGVTSAGKARFDTWSQKDDLGARGQEHEVRSSKLEAPSWSTNSEAGSQK
ncbi:hypothetical protein CEB3_c45700 [Peptococcaceae bacterium CEB3]|nr:hypothetical protein CEB3_c45700 [Peptococcaceae bacterium CEB3]